MKIFNESEVKAFISQFNTALHNNNLSLSNRKLENITIVRNEENEVLINLFYNINIADTFIYNTKTETFYTKTYILDRNRNIVDSLKGGIGSVYESALQGFVNSIISII